MAIQVLCAAGHKPEDRGRPGTLEIGRDEKGHLVLEPQKGWRVVEIRRTVGGKSKTEVFLACKPQCEASILAEMSRKAGVEA